METSQNKIKFSIICPVYNASKYLNDCVLSILNQTYLLWELLLINDGSTDNSLELCKKFSESDPRIKTINKSNEGVSKTRNLGLSVADGDYLVFIDSDDIVSKHLLETYYKAITMNNVPIVYCGQTRNLGSITEETNDPSDKIVVVKQKTITSVYSKYSNNNMGGNCYSKILLAGDQFDSSLFVCEDALFNFCQVIKCEKVCFVDSPLYFYNMGNQNSATHQINVKKRITEIYGWNKIIDLFLKNSISTFGAKCARFERSIAFMALCEIDNLEFSDEYSLAKKYSKYRFCFLFNFSIPLEKRIKIFLYSIKFIRRKYHKL